MNQRVYLIAMGVIFVGVIVTGQQAFFGDPNSFEDIGTIEDSNEYILFGEKFYSEGKFEDAELSYIAAINLAPGLSLRAYNSLDKLYQIELSEKESNISRIYLQGIAANPRSRMLLRGLAQYYERAGQLGQALVWYKKVFLIYPQDQSSYRKILELQGYEQK